MPGLICRRRALPKELVLELGSSVGALACENQADSAPQERYTQAGVHSCPVHDRRRGTTAALGERYI